MPYFAVSLMIQIALITHAVRTGRDRIWIWILIFAPLVGSIAYGVVELLPDLLGARRVRALEAKARRALNPLAELRGSLAALETADTIDNRQRYARALMGQGQHAEALALLQQTATGLHADDPKLLLDIAEAALALGDAGRCLEAMERARAADAERADSPVRRLLYARALDAAGRIPQARREYNALITYFPGEEARFRYADLLSREGEHDLARALYVEILDRQRRAPRAYRQDQRPWAERAERQLALPHQATAAKSGPA